VYRRWRGFGLACQTIRDGALTLGWRGAMNEARQNSVERSARPSRAGACRSVLEILVALFLIALNGVFSVSEFAIVSARKVRLRTMAESGRRGAATALSLAEAPGRFLSTVQAGMTLVGVLAGAFSGAALGQKLSEILVAADLPVAIGQPLGFGMVVGLITYLTVVIGELVPKTVALRNPEAIACRVAPLMAFVSQLFGPIVWLLDASTHLIFRVFGRRAQEASAVTDEEIRTIVAEAQTAGVIEPDEQRMIAGVLRLGDRAVRAIMTPRTDTEWLDISADVAEMRAKLLATVHSRLPVCKGSPDTMIGVVKVRDLLASLLTGEGIDVGAHVKMAPVVPDMLDALDALDVLRKAAVPMALVHDEYGHFDGIVTPADVLDSIAGAFRSNMEEEEPEAVQRGDGSWLIAGWMPVDEMAELLAISLPERRGFETVAGLVINELHHLPSLGEAAETLGWRFEVVDMDGRRVDKVLATRVA
jgi:putative hemolysin